MWTFPLEIIQLIHRPLAKFKMIKIIIHLGENSFHLSFMLTVYSQQQLFEVYLKNKTEMFELAAVFQNMSKLLEGQAVNAMKCFRVPNSHSKTAPSVSFTVKFKK